MARDEYDDRDRDEPRGPDAKKRVSAPAIMLIIAGTLGLLSVAVSLVTAFTNPTAGADFFQKYVIDPLPEGAEKEKQKADFERQKAEMRSDKPMDFALDAVALILNLLTVIGGVKMRGLSGYGLAMAGSIAAIIPVSGCCCLTTPIGIWALVVLLNPVVKQGFGMNRAEPEDDFDRREGDDRR